ncbi:MAG: hypothetical protein ABJF67_14160 [Aurantimonas coralicida]
MSILNWKTLTVVLLLAAAALPYGGFGPGSVEQWSDQNLFLRAATSVAAGAPEPGAIHNVGPAFIAATIATKAVTGVDYASALILLSRASFLLTILFMMAFALDVSRGFEARFGAVLAVVLAPIASVWVMASDIPWTHFLTAAILSALVFIWATHRVSGAVKAMAMGFLAVCLYQTRSYEGQIAIMAGAIVLLIKAVALIADRETPRFREWLLHAVQFTLGAVAAFTLIGWTVGYWTIFGQYAEQDGLSVVPLHFPMKFMQLFVDTCFYTLCDGVAGSSTLFRYDLSVFAAPLSFQVPALLAAFAAAAVVIVAAPRQLPKLPAYALFCLIASAGALLAYVSAAPSGSEHLKYGFFRDFIPAMVLAVMGLVGVIAATPPGLNFAARSGFKVYFACLAALVALSLTGLPDVQYAHVEEYRLETECSDGQCSASLSAINPVGAALPYDDLSQVHVTCGDVRAVRAGSLAEMTFEQGCSIAVIPALSGKASTPKALEIMSAPTLLKRGRHTTNYDSSIATKLP